MEYNQYNPFFFKNLNKKKKEVLGGKKYNPHSRIGTVKQNVNGVTDDTIR